MAIRYDVRWRGGELRGGVQYYEPGDEVAGTVQVSADADTECRGISAQLIWHTQGRGNEDVARFGQESFAGGRLRRDAPIGGEFRFRLPSEPWSFSGKHVSVVWAIEVIVDLPMANDPVHRTRFVMRPQSAR